MDHGNELFLSRPGKCECGEEFSYVGLGTYRCEHCGREFKNEYARVRDFVEKHGNNYSILEIAEQTKVSKKVIDMFVEEGKFNTVERVKRCSECGKPIGHGNYCDTCGLRILKTKSVDKKIQGVLRENMDLKGQMHHFKKDK
jgi:predicted amidophosphoribosyltransferase